jgi:hypothetical protein
MARKRRKDTSRKGGKAQTLPEAFKKNLYKAGVSGNPLGRPPIGETVTSQIRIMLESNVRKHDRVVRFLASEFGIKNPTWAAKVGCVLLQKATAARSHSSYMIELLDRVEGKLRTAPPRRPEGVRKPLMLTEEQARTLHEVLQQQSKIIDVTPARPETTAAQSSERYAQGNGNGNGNGAVIDTDSLIDVTPTESNEGDKNNGNKDGNGNGQT